MADHLCTILPQLNLTMITEQNSEDLFNLWLIYHETRSGYLRIYRSNEPFINITDLPNIKSCVLKCNSKNHILLYYNPKMVDLSDIQLLDAKGWDESDLDVDRALGRVLGYLCPGHQEFENGYFISYDVIGIQGIHHLYSETIPQSFDMNMVNARRITLQKILELLDPRLKVSVSIRNRN